MCGIVGAAGAVGDLPLVRMRDTMSHRGPDDAGTWTSADGCVSFEHRRLAIIDLSPCGHQPMSDEAGQLQITFNGEIYNYRDLRKDLEQRGHRFRTASDTEVILEAYRAWGDECLARLNGQFAFALYDVARRRLLLARDRAGEKPLFYRHDAGRLVFASELKALMADPRLPRRLDLEALNYYLAYGYVPGDTCILQGVRKVLQGHALTYEVATDRLRLFQYWKLPPPPDPSSSVDANALVEEFQQLLGASVRRQLVADVPVGVLLSGGIDSSLVTAMAVRASPGKVRTFTITFPGHGRYDEGPFARLVARHFGTDHTELVAEPATADLLPTLARQYDEPIADSSMVPTYLVSRLIRPHATVALGGDGGDELFGGYPHYSWMLRQERIRRFLPAPLRRAVGELAARTLPPGLRGRNYVIGFTADLAESIAHVNVYFDHWTRRRLLAPLGGLPSRNGRGPEAHRASLCTRGYPLVRQASEADFRTTLVDAYLVKVDRASMLNSLEIRAPFLDQHVMEFAFGRVPDRLKATERERKILPRRLAARLLPPELDLERKQGFSLPLAAWFKGPWGQYMTDVLREADRRLFDRRVIEGLLAGQRRGFSNTARLFALTMFELWRREYRVEVAGPDPVTP